MYGHQSIRGKLLLVVLATTISALLITGLALALYDLLTYRQSLIEDLNTQADILGLAAAPALDFDDRQSAQKYLSLLEAKPGIVAAAIYTSSGKLFAEYLRPRYQDSVVLPAIPEADGFSIHGNEILLFKRIVSHDEILGTVYTQARYSLSERLLDYVGIVALVTVLSLLAALGMSRRLQRGITEPLGEITSVARLVVDERDFGARVPKTTDDEIGVLVDAFNEMLFEIGERTDTLQHANEKLASTEERLRVLNSELEQRVADRTRELEIANNDLESFSYSVSHDLRAPIRAIKGFCSLLEADHGTQLDAEARRKLGIVRDEAGRMGRLIDDLLAFSRLGRKAIEQTELDMTSMVESLWSRIAKDVVETTKFHLGSLPRASGDHRLLEQVWTNLLTNAAKFSGTKEKPVIEVGGLTDNYELVYFVRDNGAGFDPKYASRLFGVFQRLHGEDEFPGTGVGLAIVHKIVTRHGGRVWGEGQPGEGATFHFTLPRRRTDG